MKNGLNTVGIGQTVVLQIFLSENLVQFNLLPFYVSPILK